MKTLLKILSITFIAFGMLIGSATAAHAFGGFGGFFKAAVAIFSGGGIGAAIARFAFSAVLSFVAQKIFAPDVPANDAGGLGPDQGVKQRIPADPSNKLPVIYGEARTYGTITYAAISSDNQKMAFIIPLCEGPVQSIGDIYWDNYRLTLDGNGNVTNAVNSTDSSDTNDFLNGNLQVIKYTNGGRCTQMEAFDPSIWGDSNAQHRTMPNVAYLYVELTYDREESVTGLSSKLGAVVIGRPTRPIVRSGTQGNYTYSLGGANNTDANNPARCLVDYLLNNTYGCGTIIENSSELDLESFYNHQEFCNELINYTDPDGNPQTHKRYELNGLVNTNDNRDIIISDICTSSQAVFSYKYGKFSMLTDARFTDAVNPSPAYTNAINALPTFDNNNIYGNVTIINDGFNSLINKMVVSYNDKEEGYQDNQTYLDLSEDNPDLLNNNEPELLQETRFKFANNNIHAERAARVVLLKSRDNLIVSFDTDLRYLDLNVSDTITVSNDNFVWNRKLFKINSISEIEIGNDGVTGLRITAQEYSDSAYTVMNISQFRPAPNTNIPNLGSIGQVMGLSSSANSPVNRTATLSWTVPSGLVHAFDVYHGAGPLNTRIRIGEISNLDGSPYAVGTTVTANLSNIPNVANLQVSVRARNNLGFIGAPSNVLTIGSFTAVDTLQQLIQVYKRSATTPISTDRPTQNLTYTFSSGNRVFAGTTPTVSNGWYINSNDVPSSANPLYIRSAIVSNTTGSIADDGVILPNAWNSAITSGAIGSAGISVTTLYAYRYSTTVPSTPGNSMYIFNTDTLNNLDADWSRTIPSLNNGELYVTQAFVSSSTPTVAANVVWSTPVLFSSLQFEVNAYYPSTVNTVPGTPVTGTGTLTNRILTGGPTGNPSTEMWLPEPPPITNTHPFVFRSIATVTNGVIGTWSTPSLFYLRGERGPAGETTLTRYGAFTSDAEAIINRPTTLHGITNTVSNDATTGFWVTSPDLLGEDADGNAQTYTHTITQFGDIATGGSSTTNTYDLNGASILDGHNYRKSYTYTGSTPGTTQYTGRNEAAVVYNFDTNINSNYTNTQYNNGWNRDVTDTDATTYEGYEFNINTLGGISNTGQLRIDADTYGYFILTNVTLSVSGLTRAGNLQIETVDRTFVDGSAGRIYSYDEIVNLLTTTPGTTDGPQFQNVENTNQRFRIYKGNEQRFTLILVRESGPAFQITNVRSTTSFSVGVGGVVSGSEAGIVTLPTQSDNWYYTFGNDIHDGYNFIINRDNQLFDIVEAPFARNLTITQYLQFVRNRLLNSSAVNAVVINGDTLQITLDNNSVADWQITLQRRGSVSTQGTDETFTSNRNTRTRNTTIGQFATYTLNIIQEATDAQIRTELNNNLNTAKFRISDAYSNVPYVFSYDNNETTLAQLVQTISRKINNNEPDDNGNTTNHISSRVNNTGQLILTYNTTANYSNALPGERQSGPDGRNPNLILEFGTMEIGTAYVYLGAVDTYTLSTIPRGDGVLVTANRPTITAGIYNTEFSKNRSLQIDSNDGYPSLIEQVANSLVVCSNGEYSSTINNNNTTLTYNFGSNPVTDDLSILTVNGDRITSTGTVPNFSISVDPANSNDRFFLRISRNNADPDNTNHQFKNNSITIESEVNDTALALVNKLIAQAYRVGVYINIIQNQNNGRDLTFQIQDSGMGNVDINLETISHRPQSATGLTYTENTGSTTDTNGRTVRIITPIAASSSNGSFETYVDGTIDANDWTRPVNTGRQV